MICPGGVAAPGAKVAPVVETPRQHEGNDKFQAVFSGADTSVESRRQTVSSGIHQPQAGRKWPAEKRKPLGG